MFTASFLWKQPFDPGGEPTLSNIRIETAKIAVQGSYNHVGMAISNDSRTEPDSTKWSNHANEAFSSTNMDAVHCSHSMPMRDALEITFP